MKPALEVDELWVRTENSPGSLVKLKYMDVEEEFK